MLTYRSRKMGDCELKGMQTRADYRSRVKRYQPHIASYQSNAVCRRGYKLVQVTSYKPQVTTLRIKKVTHALHHTLQESCKLHRTLQDRYKLHVTGGAGAKVPGHKLHRLSYKLQVTNYSPTSCKL